MARVLAEDMRAAVLQAALEGKLTEQLPEDGDAQELLDKIKAEKEQLVNKGKLKKGKPLKPVLEDEMSFIVPDNWKWCRLQSVLDVRDRTQDQLAEEVFVDSYVIPTKIDLLMRLIEKSKETEKPDDLIKLKVHKLSSVTMIINGTGEKNIKKIQHRISLDYNKLTRKIFRRSGSVDEEDMGYYSF